MGILCLGCETHHCHQKERKMDELLEYIAELNKTQEAGELGNFPEPSPPGDLGSALTQTEINNLKRFLKEIAERFVTPP